MFRPERCGFTSIRPACWKAWRTPRRSSIVSRFPPVRFPFPVSRFPLTLPAVLPRDLEVLERRREKVSRALSFQELVRSFRVPEEEEDAFRERLDALERRGELVRVRGEKYSAIEFSNLTAGRLTVRPEGFGFVLVPGGPDLYIPRAGMHGAMDGDTVLAREERTRAHGRGRGPERISGTGVKILVRARELVVGRFQTEARRRI